MKLRERAQRDLAEYRKTLQTTIEQIERDVETYRTIGKTYPKVRGSIEDVILAGYKVKGATEGAIRVMELMLEYEFEDD